MRLLTYSKTRSYIKILQSICYCREILGPFIYGFSFFFYVRYYIYSLSRYRKILLECVVHIQLYDITSRTNKNSFSYSVLHFLGRHTASQSSLSSWDSLVCVRGFPNVRLRLPLLILPKMFSLFYNHLPYFNDIQPILTSLVLHMPVSPSPWKEFHLLSACVTNRRKNKRKIRRRR